MDYNLSATHSSSKYFRLELQAIQAIVNNKLTVSTRLTGQDRVFIYGPPRASCVPSNILYRLYLQTYLRKLQTIVAAGAVVEMAHPACGGIYSLICDYLYAHDYEIELLTSNGRVVLLRRGNYAYNRVLRYLGGQHFKYSTA